MMIQWMAYATLIAAFAFAGSVAVERVAAIWNAGQRFVWLAALVVAAVTPVLLATRPPAHDMKPAAASIETSASTEAVVVFTPTTKPRSMSMIASLEKLESRAARALPRLDPILRSLWLAASLVWLALLVRAALNVHRQRARWRRVVLDGSDVLVAPNLGPAVIGALNPRVIIPEWALSLEPEARGLMLRHESEHIRARDPLMLFAGVLLVALFPWNPALWMLMRRLRLAVEIDCDQRVLRSSSQQREYGILLLAVGARHASPMPFATSLAERRPFLERRIRAMTDSRPRNPRLMSIACVGVALTVLTAAVHAPRPQSLAAQVPAVAQQAQSAVVPARAVSVAPAAAVVPAPARASTAAASPSTEPAPARATSSTTAARSATPAPAHATEPAASSVPRRARKGGSLTEEEIRALIAVHYPSVLIGDPSINLLTFVIDAKGNYVASSSAYQPTTSIQEDKARAEANAAMGEMRGRGGRGDIVMRDDATPADSAKRAAEEMAVRARLLQRMTGDTIIVSALAADSPPRIQVRGRSSSAPVVARDTGFAMMLGGLNVNPNDIDNVEVRKTTGIFGPLYIGIIIIQLK